MSGLQIRVTRLESSAGGPEGVAARATGGEFDERFCERRAKD
jgi:hypothetical protein